MTRRGPEGKTQDAVIKYAREKYGALCKKNEAGRFGSSGWPDYMVLFPRKRFVGRDAKKGVCTILVPGVFFIEFKATGADLTTLQEHMKTQIEKLGFRVYKIDSVAYGKIVIDQECS